MPPKKSEISKNDPKRAGKKKEYSMESLEELEGDLTKTHPEESTDSEDELEVEGEMSKNCCIYTVPKTLADINTKKAYEPRVVSIGPYHGGEEQVQAMKKHKRQFLISHLLHRKQISLNDLLESKSISRLAKKASKYYSKDINYLENDEMECRFLKLMVLDGCFLIELFKKADKVEKVFERDDPLATMAWAVPYIYGDLLLVGNQIPFFVLEELFQTFKMPGDSDASLSLLALKFLNKVMQRPDGVIDNFLKRATRNNYPKPLHLLDLVRSSLLLQPDQEETRIAISNSEPSNKRKDLIYCISKLRRAGIKLRRREADSFLDVKFKKGKGIFCNGVIEMPNITI
ncbi:UPF0481 protein At3g47200-like [Corylus avellana]|uniref:UPF0481 protein At3g47200-like n=1 Tax=Corylus avellana TaxID=13451 RepID=UPI00286B400D|nr:UPF0481 protein At3g47200-like [Corylus avellana]